MSWVSLVVSKSSGRFLLILFESVDIEFSEMHSPICMCAKGRDFFFFEKMVGALPFNKD